MFYLEEAMDMQPIHQGILQESAWRRMSEELITNTVSSTPEVDISENPPCESKSEIHIDAEPTQEKSFEEGYAEGKSEAEAHRQAEIDALLEKNAELTQKNADLLKIQSDLLSQIKEKINEETIKLSTTLQDEIKEVIFQITKAILKTELSLHPEKLIFSIKEALSFFSKDKKTTLCVHPEAKKSLGESLPGGDVLIEENSALNPFDFYITQEYSKLDAEFEGRIKQSIESACNA